MRIRKKALILVLAGACAAGCAHMEPFADRATAFNEEVAKTQDRTLMLNVLRAAYRYPMHFTELSTLSGTETVTGNAGLSIPFSHPYGTGDMRTGTLSASVSQSPTFNVAVLETQEFYKGMMTQLSVDQLNGYLSEGIPHEVIFMLAFSGFRFQSSTTDTPVTVSNNFHEILVGSPEKRYCGSRQYESECFTDILRALKDRQFTVEATQDATNVGPPLDVRGLMNLKDLQLANAGGLQITAFDLADCEAHSSACSGAQGFDAVVQKQLLAGETFYRLQKIAKESRFCFDVPVNDDQKGSKPLSTQSQYPLGSIAHEVESQEIPLALICADRIEPKPKPSRAELVRTGRSTHVFEGNTEPSRGALWARGGAAALQGFPAVEMRSTEGVIYYLGEIARCEMSGKFCPVPKARIEDLNGEKALFCVLKNGVTAQGCGRSAKRLDVSFGGDKFEVPMSPDGEDRSGQVLRVVTQLVALNRAAKDFPVPAIIPLISH